MPFRHSDDPEALLLVRGSRCGIVRSYICENLFVTFSMRRLERGRKEAFGYALSPTSKINIGANDTGMIEGMGVFCEWRHALEADDDVIA